MIVPITAMIAPITVVIAAKSFVIGAIIVRMKGFPVTNVAFSVSFPWFPASLSLLGLANK